MTISEATIAAYVDGELGESERRAVEAAAEDDPILAARLSREAALRDRLAAAFRPILDEPIPEALTQVVVASNDRAPRRVTPTWVWGGIAASWLVAGLIGAASVQALRPGPYAPTNAGVEAGRALSRELASLPAGEASPSGVRVVFSFRKADTLCRAFTRQGDSGVACQEGGRWRLATLVQGAPQTTTAYRQAASSLPGPVLAFVDAEMVGDRLSSAEEAAARARGWRP